jgi:hypothetical protein
MIVTSQNMNILARLALQNPDLLLHYLRTMDARPDIVSIFVDKWAGQKVNSHKVTYTLADYLVR